jgi:phosphoketolase
MAAGLEISAPLSPEELGRMDAYWRACNYLSVGMIFLRANPLLRERSSPNTSTIACRVIGARIPANRWLGSI